MPGRKPRAMCWTISNGVAKSRGNPDRMFCSTGGPPVEAPMPIMRGSGCRAPVVAVTARGNTAAGRWRFQRRTTRTSDMSRMVCCRFSTQLANCG